MPHRSWTTGIVAAASVALAAGGAAEGDQVLATVGKPAIVAVAPRATSAASATARVVLSVTGYRPAADGGVEAVVTAQKPDGSEQVIGRFSVFADAPFDAASPSQAQRFGFALPRALAGDGPVTLKVELVPYDGSGAGARLELGSAELQ